jgi:hypothetical protein
MLIIATLVISLFRVCRRALQFPHWRCPAAAVKNMGREVLWRRSGQ